MCFKNKLEYEDSSASAEATCCGPDFRFSSGEPSLDEILADPLIRLLMARDHVEDSTLRHLAMSKGRRAPASLEVAP